MSLLSESKRFNDFTPKEKRQIFDIFTQSYVKATGSSWDENKFYSRAEEWLFFGDPTGFVTVRPQKSGYYKLTGVAGNMKSILKALQELNTTNYPIWGMLTQELANILVKRYGFRMPNRLESFIIGKLISNNVFGNVEHKRNPDGSITFNYTDVGESTKVFVGNREYYKKARLDAVKRVFSPKQPVNEEIIDEKRAVEHYFEDSFKLVSEYIRRYGYEHTYASFRKTANTTFINRTNAYNTPTGFYMYPLKNYADKIAQTTNMESFMKGFPFTPDSKFCFLFTITNYDNILSSLQIDVEKIHEYVRKIKEKYGEKKPAIATLCDLYFTPEGFTSRMGYSYKNEFQKFWLFLYEIAFELRNNNAKYEPSKYESNFQERPSSITIIADEIGLTGFIDDGCMSIIHSGEPCQGVLLSNIRETLANLKIVPIYQKYDAPLNIDNPDAPTVNPVEYKNKYEKYLAGKLQAKNITIDGNEYQNAIKNHMPFIIHINDYTPFYIDRDGNKTVKGLDVEKILTNDLIGSDYDNNLKTIQRTAYINSLFNTKYDEVRPFGKYGGDIAFAIGTDGTYSFINKKGQPDITDVDINKIGDGKTRAIYFNQLLGKELYDNVNSFGEFGGELARALTLNGENVYINKAGEQDISKVDVTKITDSNSRAIIINQKLGKKLYSSVGDFNRFGQGIAAAYSEKTGAKLFINTEGRPSIKGINIVSINDSDLRAAYFNQKFKKKLFSFVGNYDRYGAGVTIAKYANTGESVFINTLGQPAIDQVNIDNIDDTNIRALYINQKYGTDFTSVGLFDKIGTDVAYAVREGGEVVFINREGKPSMGNVDINKIDDSHVRAVFINKLMGTQYTSVSKFGDLGGDVAFAMNPENLTYEFINRKGEKDMTGVELDKIRDRATRAAYFNQKYGTKYESVGEFGKYGDNAAKAFEEGKGRFFINREGVPDTSGVDMENINDAYDRADIYNQRFGTDYAELDQFGQYGKNIAVAFDSNSNRYFVNNKGKKTTVGVDINSLPESLRALYINQKYKKDYKTVGNFGRYGENVGIARTKDNRNIIINREGKPDVSGIDPEEIKNMNSNVKAAYFNTINGTKFTDIYDSLINNQTNVFFGSLPDSGYAFVDNKGKPTLKIKNLKKVIEQYGKTTVEDIINNTKEMLAGKLKENYSILHSLVNEEISNYFQN